MRSLKNLQVVSRQQLEEFAMRPFFPISQAAVAVSLIYKLFQVPHDLLLINR